jgi:hypothetical protein
MPAGTGSARPAVLVQAAQAALAMAATVDRVATATKRGNLIKTKFLLPKLVMRLGTR